MPSMARRKFRFPNAGALACLAACCFTLCVTSACGSSMENNVQIRAADDFECTPGGIDVEEVARSRYRARGCGKEGEYVCSATPDGVDCSQAGDLDVETPSTYTTESPSAEPSAPAP